MNTEIENLLNHLQSAQFAALFLDALLKSFVVLGLAAGVCALWRKASAGTRHLIWFLAVISLPCLPMLKFTRAVWQKPVWAISTTSSSGNQISLALQLAPNAQPTPGGPSAQNPPDAPKASTSVGSADSPKITAYFDAHWMLFGWFAWLTGVAVVLIRLAGGRFYRRKFSRLAQSLKSAEWTRLLNDSCKTLRLRRPVTLLQSADDVMPMTWGWMRPVVLLPAEAAQWPEERRRIVLLHELAHVKRGDYFTQTVAQLICALYWFNPLIWLAARQMCVEREGACDDLVLTGGCRASEYAGHLVEIAVSFQRVPQMAAIAMARSSQLEDRIAAIVDTSRNRRLRSAAALAILALIGGVAVCIGSSGTNSAAAMIGGRSPAADAAGWTNWNNGQDIGSFYAVAAAAREVVAVGIDGRIARRDNATGIWKIKTFTGDPDFRGIAYANNQYVVVREAGSIMTSKDGLTWQFCESPTDKNLLGLNWVGNQFLAGGDNGTILSSPDGVNWTSRNSGCSISFYSFSYSGSRYVAVGNDGIRISSDSVTWTAPATAPDSIPFTACTWTGSEFLACGLGLDRQPTIYTSPDGEVWTLRDSTITASLRAAITIDGTIYVAGDSVVAKSDDGGTTWINTFKNTGGNRLFMGLASDGEYLIAAGFNHNVWAMPESGPTPSALSTPANSSVFQMRLAFDAPADNTAPMRLESQAGSPAQAQTLYLANEVLLDHTALESAKFSRNELGYAQIDISFNKAGTKQFAEITRQHLHEKLAIIIDGKLWVAPVIHDPITGGKATVTGSFSDAEGKELAAKINEAVK